MIRTKKVFARVLREWHLAQTPFEIFQYEFFDVPRHPLSSIVYQVLK